MLPWMLDTSGITVLPIETTVATRLPLNGELALASREDEHAQIDDARGSRVAILMVTSTASLAADVTFDLKYGVLAA